MRRSCISPWDHAQRIPSTPVHENRPLHPNTALPDGSAPRPPPSRASRLRDATIFQHGALANPWTSGVAARAMSRMMLAAIFAT